MRLLTTLIVSLLLNAASAIPVRAADPGTEEQKTFYALGLIISQSLAPFALSESELEFVRNGMTDGVLKKTSKVDLSVYGP